MEFGQILEVEDSMSEANVFVGISGERAMADAYMTTCEPKALEAWFKSNPFPLDILKGCCEYWKTNVNVGPPLKIAAILMERWMVA